MFVLLEKLAEIPRTIEAENCSVGDLGVVNINPNLSRPEDMRYWIVKEEHSERKVWQLIGEDFATSDLILGFMIPKPWKLTLTNK